MSAVSRGFMPAVGSSSSSSVGLERQRAGDLEPALVAVRAGSWRARCRCRARPTRRAAPVPADRRRPPRGGSCGVLKNASAGVASIWLCMPDEHVLDRGHVLEQPDVLERPPDARAATIVVRAGAPEDPEPARSVLVPDRPDDRQRAAWSSSRHDGDHHGGQEPADHARLARARSRGARITRATAGPTRRTPARSGCGRVIIRRPPNSTEPAVGSMIPAMHVEERRLAGTVGPDEADDRSLGDREVDLVDRDQAAEPPGDLVATRMSSGGVRRAVGADATGSGRHRSALIRDRRAVVSSSPSCVLLRCGARRFRRLLGNRPSGRTASSRTSAMPYSRNWTG